MNHYAVFSIWRGYHTRMVLYFCMAISQLFSCQLKEDHNENDGAGIETPIAYGIDISHYQGDELDFVNRKSDSLTFVICKATEGKKFVDPDFASNWAMIKSNKFIGGAYHFFRCDQAYLDQANNYFSTVIELGLDDLPPIVDFEIVDPCSNRKEIQDGLLTFLTILQKRSTRIPIIYTNVSFGNEYLNNPKFAKYPLWIANWTTDNTPSLPSVWAAQGWKFWQKSNQYHVHSIQTDFDLFNGNAATLKQFIRETTLSY